MKETKTKTVNTADECRCSQSAAGTENRSLLEERHLPVPPDCELKNQLRVFVAAEPPKTHGVSR